MSKKNKKKKKSIVLKASQQYTEKQLDVLAKFKMGPQLGLCEKDAQLIDAVAELGDVSFYSLCDRFDEKPSKVYKMVAALREKNLVNYSDTEQIISLTPLAIQFMGCSLEDSKSQKKFRKFIESLNDEELDRFVELVDQFKIDESLNEPAETDEDAEDEDEEIEDADDNDKAEEAEDTETEDEAEDIEVTEEIAAEEVTEDDE